MPPWVVAALPWIIVPIVIIWRARPGTDLSAYPAEVGANPELLSLIVPARNEARNIERCMRSILTTSWPRMELFVVNDNSTDGTGDIARRVAAGDPRVTVIDASPLPDGWFGKQWACHTAVQRAKGTTLVFTDADTTHTEQLLARSMRAMRERGADMLSVMGFQELGTFWERLLMPQLIVFIVARFGNGEAMSRSKDPMDKIANGQFYLLRRAAYDRAGGHEAVRDHVAEDLRIAQEVCRTGSSVQFISGLDYIRTRMYEGLGEVMRGWGKNVYAGGRDTLRLGPVGRVALRWVFPLPPLWYVAPTLLGALAFGGVLPIAVAWWAISCYAAGALFWIAIGVHLRVPPWYAFLHPLGALMTFVLFLGAAWRGGRVEWKGREYQSVSPAR